MKTFLAGIPLLLLITGAAFGDTLTVTNQDDSGPGSLREAVMNAISGDIIKFDLPLPNTISLSTGEILIDKNLTIAGPGANVLTVERSSDSLDIGLPVLHIAQGFFDVTINGLTVAKGLTGGAVNSGTGGGLDNQSSGTVTVSGCTFRDNFAFFGGGAVSNEGEGILNLTDCMMLENTTNGTGGGLFTKFGGGSVTLVRCTFASNTAKAGGGAIWNSGNDNNVMSITDSRIDQNSVTAIQGESTAFGGGIFNDGTMTIEGCTISNDSTSNGSGGGLFNFNSVTVTNSTFYGNTSSDSGGGIENAWIATVSDCTITSNAASQLEAFGTVPGGGGLGSAGGTLFNVTTIKNTIIARNDSPTNPDVAGEILSDGYNLIGDGTGGTIVPATGDQIGTTDAPIDPLLGTLSDNGGPTQTCALLPGSPAVDAGDPDAPATDQRGYNRVDVPDIGAFELGATIPKTLANISTRLLIETGDNVLIGGFIVNGTHNKPVLLRAIGPSLALDGKLADPVLELHNSSGATIASNDDWETNANKEDIIDTGLPPTDPKESALLVTLDPGAYTAIVHGANDSSGIALVEAYDLDQTTDAKLANISTRGFVQTGDNVMIGGFIVLGTLDETVLIRAIGPSLPVSNTLADPTLELHDADGATVASNDNWRDTQEAEIEATGLPPNDDAESAILSTLAPGGYTAIVRGVGDTTGVALIEAYGLN
jgi:hypothetical protein